MEQFIILWIASALISLGIEVSEVIKGITLIGKQGYKLKVDEEKSNNEDNSGLNGLSPLVLLIYLVPGANLLKAFHTINNMDKTIDIIKNVAGVQYMNDYEKEIFDNNPNFLTMVYISSDSCYVGRKTTVINYKDGSQVKFLISDTDQIYILDKTHNKNMYRNEILVKEISDMVFNDRIKKAKVLENNEIHVQEEFIEPTKETYETPNLVNMNAEIEESDTEKPYQRTLKK